MVIKISIEVATSWSFLNPGSFSFSKRFNIYHFYCDCFFGAKLWCFLLHLFVYDEVYYELGRFIKGKVLFYQCL